MHEPARRSARLTVVMTIEAVPLSFSLRQHGRDHRVSVGRVRDRRVRRSAAPARRTAWRRVTYRAGTYSFALRRGLPRAGRALTQSAGMNSRVGFTADGGSPLLVTRSPGTPGAFSLCIGGYRTRQQANALVSTRQDRVVASPGPSRGRGGSGRLDDPLTRTVGAST